MKDRDRVLLQMAQMAYRLIDGEDCNWNCNWDDVNNFVTAAMERIEWLENQVHAPAQPNTLEWKAKLKKFLES